MATKKRETLKHPRPRKRAAKPPANGDICFTIMPYGEWFDHYYESIYKRAIGSSGLVPRRADDLYRPGVITNDIWELTQRAKVILADLSGKNPNVFYELGLAHALDKPAILITDSMDDVPFDLRSHRVILYDKNLPKWGEILLDAIRTAIGEALASPAAARTAFRKASALPGQQTGPGQQQRGGAQAQPKATITMEAAREFAGKAIVEQAPVSYIISVLERWGFTNEEARSILESLRPKVPQQPE